MCRLMNINLLETKSEGTVHWFMHAYGRAVALRNCHAIEKQKYISYVDRQKPAAYGCSEIRIISTKSTNLGLCEVAAIDVYHLSPT
jgi:hypothetical protein